MPTWILAILTAIVRALLPFLTEKVKRTAEDGRRDPELRKRLQARLRKSAWVAGALILALALALPGCTRTIYVPAGEPVRLRETIRDAKVWVLDADGQPAAGKMDLPEGWYALDDPGPPTSP